MLALALESATSIRSTAGAQTPAPGPIFRFEADGFWLKLIGVTTAMRVAPDATAAALKIDPELRSTLIRASQVYRLAFWPKHQAENHARARDFTGQLKQHGSQVRDYITRAYQLDWPRHGYLVNVSGYTNWAGAYSTAGTQ